MERDARQPSRYRRLRQRLRHVSGGGLIVAGILLASGVWLFVAPVEAEYDQRYKQDSRMRNQSGEVRHVHVTKDVSRAIGILGVVLGLAAGYWSVRKLDD